MRYAFIFCLIFLIICGCRRAPEAQNPVLAEDVFIQTVSSLHPADAILKTGTNPLWFEFSADGPVLISSPIEASLAELLPWPRSRYSAGMLAYGDTLAMAVNRLGFFVFREGGEEGSAVLSLSIDPEYWDTYTIASVLVNEEKPAALLYRDDFFGRNDSPLPEHQLMVLSDENIAPVGVHVPAFDMLARSEGWQINSLRRSADGKWYYRYVQSGGHQPETVYFRTDDPGTAGERANLQDYRNSSEPQNPANAPDFLFPLFEAFASLPGISVLHLLNSGYDSEAFGLRNYSSAPLHDEDFFHLYGYYDLAKSTAFAITADGKGFLLLNDHVSEFALSLLPEGFVYTGAGQIGGVLIASWEEQMDSAIGAAGFMAVNASFFIDVN